MYVCIYIYIYIYIYTYTHSVFWLFLSSELCPIPSDFGRTHHILYMLTCFFFRKQQESVFTFYRNSFVNSTLTIPVVSKIKQFTQSFSR